jgi:hypothetical protein
MAVESKIDEIRKAVEVLYATLKEQAAAAQAKRAESEVKAIRDRVARWGLADKSAALDAHLKGTTPPPPGLKWTPIFDGKSLDFLVMNGEGAWVLDNGGLLHVKGRKNSAQTKRHFTDGDFRVWFKVRDASHVGFAIRQGEEGFTGVSLGGAELNQLDDKQHEFLISCRGSDVKAFLDDKPFPVEVNGKSLKGPLQFNAYGEYFVIKLLEFRDPAENANPVGHWRFDGVSGGQVADASGQGNTGTLVDGPAPVTGALGGALQFDGRKSHVSVASSPSLSITGPLSITAWVNPKPSDDKTQARAIVEKWDGTASANFSGYLLRVTTRGSVQFVISEPARCSEVATTKPLPVDTWTFLAAVFDGANVRIYVNGTLDRTLPATATPGPSQGALRIGMGGGGGAHYFLGAIDDVRVYNRALSPEEVTRIGAR